MPIINSHYGLILEGMNGDIHALERDLTWRQPFVLFEMLPEGRYQMNRAVLDAMRRQTVYISEPIDREWWRLCVMVPSTSVEVDTLLEITQLLHARFMLQQPNITGFVVADGVYSSWLYDPSSDTFTHPQTAFVATPDDIKRMDLLAMRMLLAQTLPGGDFAKPIPPVPTHDQFLADLNQKPLGRLPK